MHIVVLSASAAAVGQGGTAVSKLTARFCQPRLAVQFGYGRSSGCKSVAMRQQMACELPAHCILHGTESIGRGAHQSVSHPLQHVCDDVLRRGKAFNTCLYWPFIDGKRDSKSTKDCWASYTVTTTTLTLHILYNYLHVLQPVLQVAICRSKTTGAVTVVVACTSAKRQQRWWWCWCGCCCC